MGPVYKIVANGKHKTDFAPYFIVVLRLVLKVAQAFVHFAGAL